MAVDDQQIALDRKVYALAREFLLSLERITPEILDRHLSISKDDRPNTLTGIYQSLLEVAQGGNMGPQVIGLVCFNNQIIE